MRVFWALIGVLAVAAAVSLWASSANPIGDSPAPHEEPAAAAPNEAPEAALDQPQSSASSDPEPVGSPIPPPVETPPAELVLDPEGLNKVLGIDEAVAVPDQHVEEASMGAAEPAPIVPTASDPVATPTEPQPIAAVTEVTPDAAPPTAATVVGAAAVPAASAPVAQEAPLPAEVVKQEDGSLLIDGRYIVKGSGTAAAPYIVPWEMLVSVQTTYAPRLGKKQLPERVTMFDGKIVEIAGYVAFPLMEEEPRELLSMLNQWDGCCIGVPPTPYDAIEVQLKGKVADDSRFAKYGTVKGRFGVKPHLVGQWLVGLYVMDEATLETREYGGFGS